MIKVLWYHCITLTRREKMDDYEPCDYDEYKEPEDKYWEEE
jgi:hypothetical protein